MEKVLKQYTPYVYKIICNKNQFLSTEDIEEIASDVFLAIWKNQQILDLNRSMSAYLSGITKICTIKKCEIYRTIYILMILKTHYFQKKI